LTLAITSRVVPIELSSWAYVYAVLANHVKAGDSDEDTVNRLWNKSASEPHPRISELAAGVHLERWSLDRLWTLMTPADMTEEPPHSEENPPVVVRWGGEDYRIDGRRRIIRLKKREAEGPHAVLIINLPTAKSDV
jgi:hypothetical protein